MVSIREREPSLKGPRKLEESEGKKQNLSNTCYQTAVCFYDHLMAEHHSAALAYIRIALHMCVCLQKARNLVSPLSLIYCVQTNRRSRSIDLFWTNIELVYRCAREMMDKSGANTSLSLSLTSCAQCMSLDRRALLPADDVTLPVQFVRALFRHPNSGCPAKMLWPKF